MRNSIHSESGFGIVEAVTATLITMAGVLSVAALFMVGSRMQSVATNSSSAVGLAAAELERIRTLAPSALERGIGGLLTENSPNHWATRGRTIVRWQISEKNTLCAPIGGVPGAASECARDVVVVAISPNGLAIQARLTGILWR
jgi:Tfp pilus assembly protein PilV